MTISFLFLALFSIIILGVFHWNTSNYALFSIYKNDALKFSNKLSSFEFYYKKLIDYNLIQLQELKTNKVNDSKIKNEQAPLGMETQRGKNIKEDEGGDDDNIFQLAINTVDCFVRTEKKDKKVSNKYEDLIDITPAKPLTKEKERLYYLFLTNVTYRDMYQINIDELLKYDVRGHIRYFFDLFMTKHIIIETFFSISVLYPKFLMITLLFLKLTLQFALNAIFYSDDYINARKLNADPEQTVYLIL